MVGVKGVATGDALQDIGSRYLVIVALNGKDDKPDLRSIRAFIASAGQGIVYRTGIWREYDLFQGRVTALDDFDS